MNRSAWCAAAMLHSASTGWVGARTASAIHLQMPIHNCCRNHDRLTIHCSGAITTWCAVELQPCPALHSTALLWRVRVASHDLSSLDSMLVHLHAGIHQHPEQQTEWST